MGRKDAVTRKGYEGAAGVMVGGILFLARDASDTVFITLLTLELYAPEVCTFLFVCCTSIKASKNIKRKSEILMPK